MQDAEVVPQIPVSNSASKTRLPGRISGNKPAATAGNKAEVAPDVFFRSEKEAAKV